MDAHEILITLDAWLIRERDMKKRLFLLALLVIISLSSCSFTGINRQVVKKSEIKLEIVDLPKEVKRTQTAIFTIKTMPNNRCISGIGYWSKGEWMITRLPEMAANEEGICQWNWTVPSEAKDGWAEFRVLIYQGSDSKSLVPYQFCIEHCPEQPGS